jgi:effector-binding domain-containing protein
VTVALSELQAQPMLSIRATIPVAKLGDTMGERIGVLSRFLHERGMQPAGPPFVRYHTFTDTDTDMEFGVPVTEALAGDGQIAAGELPEGPAVTTWHVGAPERLGEAYERIEKWRVEHGREPAGPAAGGLPLDRPERPGRGLSLAGGSVEMANRTRPARVPLTGRSRSWSCGCRRTVRKPHKGNHNSKIAEATARRRGRPLVRMAHASATRR